MNRTPEGLLHSFWASGWNKSGGSLHATAPQPAGADTGELRVGKRAEGLRNHELADDEKAPVPGPYLRRWKAEASPFFNGIGPDSNDEQLRAIAADHPTFEVFPAG